MLKPSKKIIYAMTRRTYEKKAFLRYQSSWESARNGTKAAFWQVTATPITTNGQQLDRTHIKFTTPSRVKLGELRLLSMSIFLA